MLANFALYIKQVQKPNIMKPNKKRKYVHHRDRSRIAFNGEKYGKGKLVLAVVEKYVADHPGITYDELKAKFPDNLHSLGIIQPVKVAKAKSKDHQRFHKQVIKLADAVIAVCSDFGINNIRPFLKNARTIGYNVRLVAA
jgi:hypothetical protein